MYTNKSSSASWLMRPVSEAPASAHEKCKVLLSNSAVERSNRHTTVQLYGSSSHLSHTFVIGEVNDMRTALDEKLALVVPTLNEAGNIQRLLSEVSEVLSPLGVRYEILVVDDNSSDNTADLVLEYSQIDPHVRLLSRKDEKGLAGAVIHGWLHTDADLLGVIDADLQHPPSLLPGLLGAMADGADIAIVATLRKTDAGLESVRVAISRATTLATLPFQRRESE